MKSGQYWQPFSGGDSLKLEVRYRTLPLLDHPTSSTCIDVMGDLYEADLRAMTCTAIYWSGKDDEHVLVCVCVCVCVHVSVHLFAHVCVCRMLSGISIMR